MSRSVKVIRQELAERPARSAWDKGVQSYAKELFDEYVSETLRIADEDTCIEKITEADLLNGASDWSQYSWGGCAEIYDEDICERLCTESEKKKTRYGERRLNANEEWLDVQARALQQAAKIILRIANRRAL